MDIGDSEHKIRPDYYHRFLEYAVSLISKYDGKEPFHIFIKKYFSTNKRHGSRDRKQITSLCYQYFRLGNGVRRPISIEDKLRLALFLLGKSSPPVTESLEYQWKQYSQRDITFKLKMVEYLFSPDKIFPLINEVSNEIDKSLFSLSFLVQPQVFIRIRPGYKNTVLKKLESTPIHFVVINDDCLAFDNDEKISKLLATDKEVVIQDYNSQRTGELLNTHLNKFGEKISIWDCCAGSGGKSILVYDQLKNINLTVSDKRKEILKNLYKRFAKAGIKNYESFVNDLTISGTSDGSFISVIKKEKKYFDVIIADVPCSGSGTWARTPEKLNYFPKKDIEYYSGLQKKIVSNIVPYLNSNGYLLYITCSVFKKENEENVDFIRNKWKLELIESAYLKGYEMQADTMFVALFRNPLMKSASI